MYIDSKNYGLYYKLQDSRIDAPLFEVDELIAPIISILNNKGYKTEYCCSGHFNRSRTYIVFSDQYTNIITSDYPDNFDLSDGYENNHMCLGSEPYRGEEFTKDRLVEIVNNVVSLWRWAEELPIN